MRTHYLICLLAFFTITLRAQPETSVSSFGWTISANEAKGTIHISYAHLGDLLANVRLQSKTPRGVEPLEHWSAKSAGPNILAISSEHPRMGWQFEAGENWLKISSTDSGALLTANTPAPPERLVVRLIDRQGAPVNWTGTNEVKSGYGGKMTINPSFLPRKNAECMYFSLGRVSGSQFHALFDRDSDTAIDFSQGTVLQRTGGDPERLELTMPVEGNAIVRLIPDYYTKALGAPYYQRFDDTVFKSAPMVWSSWTSYYEAVRQEDIVRNADWLAANLKPFGFEYVQLDDGYDRDADGQHYWIENWDKTKFPNGPQWLAQYIKSKGLRPGIWLVPNAYAGAVKDHPDWYVRDKQGKIIRDYNTPALDSSNPEVVAFVKHLFNTLDGWGFEYYKFDGEHALPKYIPALDTSILHDSKTDPLIVYRKRLRAIRDTIGPNRFIEGCPAGTPLNGIGYFNSYFTGQDLYNNWQGMYPLFSSINANAFLNHVVVYVMPGEGLELGPRMTVEEASSKRPPIVIETARTRENPMIGFGVTLAEARSLVSYVALTGVAYPLASVMPELPPERIELLKKTMPTLPILPMDLFSRGTDIEWGTFLKTQADYYIHNYPEILDLKVNDAAGRHDVVAMTNWRSQPANRELDFATKLGLNAGDRYVVFDFWSQKLLGVFQGKLQVEIQPHDTRVLFIRPLQDHPQLAGISRHISGSYSIRGVSWQPQTKTLQGVSESVEGEPYSLTIYVPSGAKVVAAQASAGGMNVPVRQNASANELTITFNGQRDPVEWAVRFAETAAR